MKSVSSLNLLAGMMAMLSTNMDERVVDLFPKSLGKCKSPKTPRRVLTPEEHMEAETLRGEIQKHNEDIDKVKVAKKAKKLTEKQTMLHIDDWLDTPSEDPEIILAKEFLEYCRRPAMDKEDSWLRANPLFCTYKEERWKVLGASRMGDVWLTKHFDRIYGYDIRIYISECSNFSKTSEYESNSKDLTQPLP